MRIKAGWLIGLLLVGSGAAGNERRRSIHRSLIAGRPSTAATGVLTADQASRLVSTAAPAASRWPPFQGACPYRLG